MLGRRKRKEVRGLHPGGAGPKDHHPSPSDHDLVGWFLGVRSGGVSREEVHLTPIKVFPLAAKRYPVGPSSSSLPSRTSFSQQKAAAADYVQQDSYLQLLIFLVYLTAALIKPYSVATETIVSG